ncbi:hypothetical protein DMN91_002896 [Ooceraea biroi]|uniref:Uncharacterized protein n=1 Tax=Ooceraea biroi TaxID=2015173 RepID=A0A3L8DWQ4_OOCBI|nr:hypothetical protein DMN91_002896 [Ooceraea biroi]
MDLDEEPGMQSKDAEITKQRKEIRDLQRRLAAAEAAVKAGKGTSRNESREMSQVTTPPKFKEQSEETDNKENERPRRWMKSKYGRGGWRRRGGEWPGRGRGRDKVYHVTFY